MRILAGIILGLFLLAEASASPVANVVKLKGKVVFAGRPLHEGAKILHDGIVETGPRSYVKIETPFWGNSIVIGPNSQMEFRLENPKEKKKYSFLKGACRWVRTKKTEKKGAIHTSHVSLGIRGTDFVLIVNPVFGESEVAVLDGEVLMTNASQLDDKKIVKKGQWGGVGGRYGSTIGEILDLPNKVIDKFEKILRK